MRHHLLLAATCTALASASVQAQTPRMAPTDSALLARLDAAIEAAVVQGDTLALDTLYAADFTFTHSTGEVDDRVAWLHRSAARPRPFRSRTVDSVTVDMHGPVALTSGRLTVSPSEGRGYVVRYVRLYGKSAGRWELKSHRSVELREQRWGAP
jgi:hypothetical protein